MKSNVFLNKFKYFILIPAFVGLLAIVLGVIFGFNTDYDFKNVSSFNVKFGTTVSNCEYKCLENTIGEFIAETGIDDYRIERTGAHASNGVVVKIVNSDGEFDNLITEIKDRIESELAIESQVESPVNITTAETALSTINNVGRTIWFSLLALGLIMLVVFFYNFIRYNLISGVTGVLSILLSAVMQLSVILVARIPVNNYVFISFFVGTILTILFGTIINNNIKNTLRQEKYNKIGNEERVVLATKTCMPSLLIISIALIVFVLGTMFFGNLSLIYTSLAVLTSIIIALFVTTIIGNSLWAFWYKKDKDMILKRRIEIEKKKEEKKDKTDDKIVV